VTRTIKLRIEGAGVSPDTVQLPDLLGLLRDFQTALIATAIARGVPRDEIRISLTSIGDGSDRLGFKSSPATHRQAVRLVRAIETDNPRGVPMRARASVHDIWRKLAAKEWSLEIDASRRSTVRKATIFPSKEPFSSSRASGSTSQLAYILRAGGEKPTVQIRLPNGTKLTARVPSKDVAEELGQHLYHWVELIGDAKWGIKNWKLDEFVVRAIGTYREKASDPSKALDDLRKIAGTAWGEIDPQEYIRELRSDD
jgi:hypothetical protein